MSTGFRVVLVLIQAFANQLACTPPNPTPTKGRYHTEELYILRIAPFIFKCHQIIFWLCSVFEVLYFLQPYLPSFPSSSSSSPLITKSLGINNLSTLICPAAPTPSLLSSPSPSFTSSPAVPIITTTPCFIIGVLAVLLGTYIRLNCFRALGHMFTFDLTIHPSHTLVTDHFYAYVRHPAYTGSLLLVGGLTLSHLTKASWLTECGPLANAFIHPNGNANRNSGGGGGGGGPSVLAIWIWAVWWIWTICVGVSRADAEDKQMKKLFKDEWEVYAVHVPWWFFPWII